MTEEQYKTMKMVVDEKTNPICAGLGEHEELDAYGIYSTGIFASSKSSTTAVGYSNGVWRMAIQSKNPLGLVQLEAYKRTFIPDNVTMAILFGKRESKPQGNIYHLVQVQDGRD